ncbi:Ger(x)C family spore germination protein [Lederbergia galactosidilytica]|uniref:Ger(x)C family spore germination protein n=1 Tax=Lederbergia galactosidilytica TaxID=217031 RepID=UPI001EE563F2|nr:Ger(x)C family spore germination protein [Lederbergia galactosidilytica]
MRIFLTLLVPIVLLSGCWDKRELTDIAFVAAIGVDKAEDGGFIGTFQIINPGNVAGGLQGGSGQDSSTVTVYEIYGDNLTEVSRQAASEISRVLFYSHANLVVIGEELAKEKGIASFLDALDRDDRFRDTARVVIAKDTSANNLLKVSSPIDKIPANKITKTLEFSEQQWGEQWPVNIRELLNALSADGREAIIPSFKYFGSVEEGERMENLQSTAPETVLKADSIAVFKKDKLIGYLHGEEAMGMAWIMSNIHETTIGIDWEEEKKPISFQVISEKTKVKVAMKNGKPTVFINIVARGELGEVNIPVNIEDYHVRKEIAEKAMRRIKEIVQSTITKSKEYQTDIFGIGEKLYQNDPDSWKKLKEDWNEEHYPELEAVVKVDVSISRTGLRKNPFTYEK